MPPRRISRPAAQAHRPANVKHFDSWSVLVSHILNSGLSGRPATPGSGQNRQPVFIICCTFYTYAEVSVPDLDGAVLTACCYQLPVAAVGAARGHHLLPLKGPRFEHGFVLLLRLHVPRAHGAAGRE